MALLCSARLGLFFLGSVSEVWISWLCRQVADFFGRPFFSLRFLAKTENSRPTGTRGSLSNVERDCSPKPAGWLAGWRRKRAKKPLRHKSSRGFSRLFAAVQADAKFARLASTSSLISSPLGPGDCQWIPSSLARRGGDKPRSGSTLLAVRRQAPATRRKARSISRGLRATAAAEPPAVKVELLSGCLEELEGARRTKSGSRARLRPAPAASRARKAKPDLPRSLATCLGGGARKCEPAPEVVAQTQ